MSGFIVAGIIGLMSGVVLCALIDSNNNKKYYMKGEKMMRVIDRYDLSEDEIRQAAKHCACDNSSCEDCNFKVRFSKSPSHRGACAEAFAKLHMLDMERLEDDGK